MTDQHLREENDRLRAQVRELQTRIHEPEDTLRAIRQGEIDAVVVTGADGERIYTLRTAEVLYRAMVEEMNEGALVLDPSGLILYSNPHFGRIVGVAPEVLVGQSIHRFLGDEKRPLPEQLRHATSSGAHLDFTVLGHDGEVVPVLASTNRIRLDDAEIIGMIVTDLREQRQRQELLAESHRKDEFLAMLAHELRNPLAPIRNALGMMGTATLPPPELDRLRQVIERQVGQLARLLDDLLDVQRFNHGHLELKTEVHEVGVLIETAIEALRGSAAAKSQQLVVERPAQPLHVLADAVRLMQVISNLLVNAVKYSPANSRITVSWRRGDVGVEIRVADNGIGMAPELLQRVFDPFVQGDRDLARLEGGLGLGLTLVKRLVALHGGSVRASSDGPGKGSEFTVVLPLVADAHRPPPGLAPRRGKGARRRVLVVDDNEDSAVTLRALLEHAGHHSGIAHDGDETLRMVVAFQPDIIVLDIGLPGMDGYELARHLRQIAALQQCRLVALSGYGRDEDRERSDAAGFSAHLVKPVELDRLLDIIES